MCFLFKKNCAEPTHPTNERGSQVHSAAAATAAATVPSSCRFMYKVFIHRNALILVCDFHPGAETLAQRFMDKQGGLLSEAFIWRVICQLLGALRATHAAGTALRNVHPSRVLYCRVGDRVRVNWVGCLDVLEFETRKQVYCVVRVLFGGVLFCFVCVGMCVYVCECVCFERLVFDFCVCAFCAFCGDLFFAWKNCVLCIMCWKRSR